MRTVSRESNDRRGNRYPESGAGVDTAQLVERRHDGLSPVMLSALAGRHRRATQKSKSRDYVARSGAV